MVLRKEKGRPHGRHHLNGIEGFWRYAKHWLDQYRGVPQKCFHLYRGEISFRVHDRDRDLVPLMIKLLKQMTSDEVMKILVRKR